MKILTHRLTQGADLKQSIVEMVQKEHIKAGVVIACVGCLDHVVIRMAGGVEVREFPGRHEITSVQGTLGLDDVHLHISVSDQKGNVYGGHLKDGCVVGTTAEIVLGRISGYAFNREPDKSTGYNELVIRKTK